MREACDANHTRACHLLRIAASFGVKRKKVLFENSKKQKQVYSFVRWHNFLEKFDWDGGKVGALLCSAYCLPYFTGLGRLIEALDLYEVLIGSRL